MKRSFIELRAVEQRGGSASEGDKIRAEQAELEPELKKATAALQATLAEQEARGARVRDALKAHARAWAFFRALAPTHRRDFVVWIHTAKRPETRARRLRESIRLLSAGKKLGLK